MDFINELMDSLNLFPTPFVTLMQLVSFLFTTLFFVGTQLRKTIRDYIQGTGFLLTKRRQWLNFIFIVIAIVHAQTLTFIMLFWTTEAQNTTGITLLKWLALPLYSTAIYAFYSYQKDARNIADKLLKSSPQ